MEEVRKTKLEMVVIELVEYQILVINALHKCLE